MVIHGGETNNKKLLDCGENEHNNNHYTTQ